MTRVLGLVLFVVAGLFAPFALDAWDADLIHQRLVEHARDHASQLEPRLAVEAQRVRAADPYPRLAASLALGKPLPATLYLITELATKSGLPPPALMVQPPTPLARESGPPVLSEHRVRLVTRGPPRAVHRFVQTLPDLAAPLRIEAARLTEPTVKDPAAHLELDLRVLVDAQ